MIGRNELETTFLIRASAIMQSMSIREKIKHWYEGEYLVFEKEDDRKGFPSYIFEYRHWTSHVAHFLVDRWRLDYWNDIGRNSDFCRCMQYLIGFRLLSAS